MPKKKYPITYNKVIFESGFDALPSELIDNIAKQLPLKHLSSFAQVNKRINAIVRKIKVNYYSLSLAKGRHHQLDYNTTMKLFTKCRKIDSKIIQLSFSYSMLFNFLNILSLDLPAHREISCLAHIVTCFPGSALSAYFVDQTIINAGYSVKHVQVGMLCPILIIVVIATLFDAGYNEYNLDMPVSLMRACLILGSMFYGLINIFSICREINMDVNSNAHTADELALTASELALVASAGFACMNSVQRSGHAFFNRMIERNLIGVNKLSDTKDFLCPKQIRE